MWEGGNLQALVLGMWRVTESMESLWGLYEKHRLVHLLVKCYDNKMVKSPYNCVIFPLTQPLVDNQQNFTIMLCATILLRTTILLRIPVQQN